MAQSVLFVGAHPDDETLMSGVAIAEHVAAGLDVHVLLLTDGTSSSALLTINGNGSQNWWGVTHSPSAEGYATLSQADFGAARVAEAQVAVRCLSAGLPGTMTLHRAGLIDQSITVADAKAAILAVCDQIAPAGAVWVKTHSHLVDNESDHLNAGLAARQLAVDTPARFGNLRHYVLPIYWSDPRLSQVSPVWDTPANADISNRARNATRAYGAWAPPVSYAIGAHSVSGMLATIVATPKCLFHE